MDERRSALLGTFAPEAAGVRGLRELAAGQSRWHTCLVPPAAQRVIAEACSEAYDAAFWYGDPAPAPPPSYARAVASAAYDRGVLDALTARG